MPAYLSACPALAAGELLRDLTSNIVILDCLFSSVLEYLHTFEPTQRNIRSISLEDSIGECTAHHDNTFILYPTVGCMRI